MEERMTLKTTRRLLPLAAGLTMLAALAGCTWVEPDAGGRAIRVAHGEDVSGCVDLQRTITVSVKHKVAGVYRNELKVRDELESLARNEAGDDADADTNKALDEPHEGEQKFAVYHCR
jgi:hypothetical protein